MQHPIPNAALDDRLAFLGLGGSGKTYNAGGAVERLLDQRARVCVIDPLGAWWGLRLTADGKEASPYNIVIFGGPHADIGLTEQSGALIGETVANMAESCIIDLSEIGSDAAERRFMLAFLTALYRHQAKSLLHLIVDEADMWAPQQIFDKEGGAAQLVGKMSNIVRRGRIRGFIPWLITQRPAVLSWGVLSQVTGIVAFTLTSSQDRDAIGRWVKGQADKERWLEIWGRLAELPVGDGLVWVPRRKVFDIKAFPPKKTFDSSRAPRRGEKRTSRKLKPLDVGRLKERLAAVEAEAAASDPAKLKAEIAALRAEKSKLERQAASATSAKRPPDEKALAGIKRAAIAEAKKHYAPLAAAIGEAMRFIVKINASPAGEAPLDQEQVKSAILAGMAHVEKLIKAHVAGRERELNALRLEAQRLAAKLKSLVDKAGEDVEINVDVQHNQPFTVSAPPAQRSQKAAPAGAAGGEVSNPERRILNALASWKAMGHDAPSNAQVAWLAGYSPKSTGYTNPRSALRTKAMIDYPSPDRVALMADGAALAEGTPPRDGLLNHVLGLLPGPERRILAAAAASHPQAASNEEIAKSAGYSATSTGYTNPRSALRTKELIDYPQLGAVRAADWLFP